MPNSNHIFRTMDWNMFLEKSPNYISNHFPKGDPLKNRHEIKKELQRLKIMGPLAREEMDRYVSGEITYEKYDEKLSIIAKSINMDALEEFRRNIMYLEKCVTYNRFGILPGFKCLNISVIDMLDTVQNMSQLELYSSSKQMNESIAHN